MSKRSSAFILDSHYSAACKQTGHINDRKEIVTDQKRWYVCLQGGHRAQESNKGKRCR